MENSSETALKLPASALSTSAVLTVKVPSLEKVTISLDWVPNTNHTGLYVALDKGWYADEGFEVDIQIPSDPAAALKQVASGHTEFGISFQEEITLARANEIPVVSIAAIIQHNTSAFASLKESNINRPMDFEGKKYASYGLPIEKPVLEALMRCDGGDINEVEFVEVGFDAYPALIGMRVDVAWIFMAWDGVQAEIMGYDLRAIPLYGSCIPDYYTPVIVAGEKTIDDRPDTVRRFLAATAKGYEYVIANPEEAANILLTHSPESDPELVRRSQAWLGPRYQDDAPRWGDQKLETWREFAEWMYEQGLLSEAVDVKAAFTTSFLPE